MSSKRIRNRRIEFYVTLEEYNSIQKKMANLKIDSLSKYLRSMALNGKCIYYNFNNTFEQLKELNYYISSASTNINQIAKRVTSTGSVYLEDIQAISSLLSEVSAKQKDIFKKITPKIQEV